MKSASSPIWFWQWPVVPFHKLGMDQVWCLPGNSIRSVPFLQRRFHCLWNEVVMHRVCLLFAIMALHLWLQKFFFFLFDMSHHEAYCQYRNENASSDLHKTKKITQPQNTPVPECWVELTRFHSSDFSWTSSVSWIRCILAFYQGIHVNYLVKATCLRGSTSPTSSLVQFLLCKYGDDVEDKMVKWSTDINSQVWWATEKNRACLAGVVQLRIASVALYSSRREKKRAFVQYRIIPSLARSHKKASEWLSFNIYSVTAEEDPTKDQLLTQVESSVVSHVNKHDYECRGWRYLIPAICSLQLPTFLYIPVDEHHAPCDVMKFLSRSSTTNHKVWYHLAW